MTASLKVWRTRETPPEGFLAAWNARLANTPNAHFGFDPAAIAWEAGRGRHSLCACVDEAGRGGLVVLREERGGWVSGWPWRWQLAVEDAARRDPAGLTREESEWLFCHAAALAGGRWLVCHVPHPAPHARPAFLAGATLLRRLDMDDDAILRSLDTNKRRQHKRALKEGFSVVVASTHEEMAAFHRLQGETERRRGNASQTTPDAPAPGESWREWELPWMWLLVAVRDGVVQAGSGFGMRPHGALDYRTNASTLEAKRAGANVLLAIEALRRGRDHGCHWMNWGGVTEFKREMGGERVEVTCRLGGGAIWSLHNHVTGMLHVARPKLAAWWRGVRAAREKEPA